MKAVTVLCIMFLSIFIANSQDIMTLKNGNKMTIFVSEVGSTVIKFKKSVDGPIYSMNLAEVKMIVYSNGTTDTFGTAQKV